MTIATYNLRYENREDSIAGNGWHRRCPAIVQIIRFNDFDIFGTQEGYVNQLKDLGDSLRDYAWTGVGRNDGKKSGEHSAIFYKKNKYRLLSNGDFWLSTITDRPNKGWDAALPRICSWGKFREMKTGFTFYFFNLHMDHIGVVARRESARLMVDTIRQMAGKTPAVLTGDFNIDQYNESYELINTSGLLQDAYDFSPVRYAANGTFNNFELNRFSDSRIDHIFLTTAFTVLRYGILTGCYYIPDAGAARRSEAIKSAPRLPSDHYPVMIKVRY